MMLNHHSVQENLPECCSNYELFVTQWRELIFTHKTLLLIVEMCPRAHRVYVVKLHFKQMSEGIKHQCVKLRGQNFSAVREKAEAMVFSSIAVGAFISV